MWRRVLRKYATLMLPSSRALLHMLRSTVTRCTRNGKSWLPISCFLWGRKMANKIYEPIPINARMGNYGYWLVEVSVSPWQRMTIMVCQVGITPDKAIADALSSVAPALGRK